MIKDIFRQKKTVFSLEVFPPKPDYDISKLYQTLDELKELSPDFISVTYGAGGSSAGKTIEIASYIQNNCNIEALAHLTCVDLTEYTLLQMIEQLKNSHIHNILALRGDRPDTMSPKQFQQRTYQHASDIIPIIKKNLSCCIAGACYPEKHPEALSFQTDLMYLKQKIDLGAEFFITQLFFDNHYFYKFMNKLEQMNIQIPICAGIMPITAVSQIHTTLELSGAYIPDKLKQIFVKYENNRVDFKKAGLDYAITQIYDLLEHQIQGIHLYTMNKADTSKFIFKQLK